MQNLNCVNQYSMKIPRIRVLWIGRYLLCYSSYKGFVVKFWDFTRWNQKNVCHTRNHFEIDSDWKTTSTNQMEAFVLSANQRALFINDKKVAFFIQRVWRWENQKWMGLMILVRASRTDFQDAKLVLGIWMIVRVTLDILNWQNQFSTLVFSWPFSFPLILPLLFTEVNLG